MKKKIAVTGGSGFIGKKIIEELLKNGNKVVSFQRTSQNLDNVETRHFDLSDTKCLAGKRFDSSLGTFDATPNRSPKWPNVFRQTVKT